MPSPVVQVKDGAGAFVATTNGNDVTAGATITIDLIDKSVDSWALTCLTTDELSSKDTPNAALAASINAFTKQATFVAPVAGRTYRFSSIVNGGIDGNGVAKTSYRTTFCVYVQTTTGLRVMAADETTEGNPTFGYLAALNAAIRSYSLYTGTRGRILSIPGEVQTTDATVTTVASFLMTDETICAFDVIVTCARRTNVTKGGRWKSSVVYRRTGAGVATIVGAIETGTAEETDAALDATIDTDGASTVRVRVTGIAASNYNWFCELRVQETTAA